MQKTASALLELIKIFLKAGDEPMGPVSPAQYNYELEEAMERISRGEFTTLEAAEKEMQSW